MQVMAVCETEDTGCAAVHPARPSTGPHPCAWALQGQGRTARPAPQALPPAPLPAPRSARPVFFGAVYEHRAQGKAYVGAVRGLDPPPAQRFRADRALNAPNRRLAEALRAGGGGDSAVVAVVGGDDEVLTGEALRFLELRRIQRRGLADPLKGYNRPPPQAAVARYQRLLQAFDRQQTLGAG